MNYNYAAVVLAAGDGKRMKSAHSKVCCELLCKPMISWVLDACARFGLDDRHICAVLSGKDDGVKELLPEDMPVALQNQRLGTGHAVQMALPFLQQMQREGVTDVCVLYGDVPFLDEDTLRDALFTHRSAQNSVTVLTAMAEDPAGYGRVLHTGNTVEIVEAADATPAQLAVREINSGIYWFRLDYLLAALPRLQNDNSQGEYYLTDVVGMTKDLDGTAGTFLCRNTDSVLGANDRKQLAALNEIARQRVFDKHYAAGVDIPCTDGVMIGPDVVIGPDTRIYPGCILMGKTVIGNGCIIGPSTHVVDGSVGDGSIVDFSRVESSVVGKACRIGPFARLRAGCTVADGVKIGNFVELNNSTAGDRSSFPHLTYIGDADIGENVNVGCGVVTVNNDGQHKYRTVVEDGAFIGSNSNLIAPVTVGGGAYIAAATTVTRDVAPEAMVFGRVRQTEMTGGARGRIKKR